MAVRARAHVPHGARALTTAAVCAGALAGCGAAADDDDRARAATTAPPAAGTPATPADPRDPRELPTGVPVRASRAVDPRRVRVIRAWTAALRAGNIDAANALWAAPAKVQNGTPVLTLASRAEIAIFNDSLPCGSVLTSAGGASAGFTIATVRLTRRRGARCDAVGANARVAILVRAGKIAEWYRLPDDPTRPAGSRRPTTSSRAPSSTRGRKLCGESRDARPGSAGRW
ncbi:MAG TPA: hypothetical protein VGO80_05950 [Solirubrobacteraceae bacterium]|jgi:hypothetical protein|nr:hypothetical protein [Solirubrobacteraceae bacterium]